MSHTFIGRPRNGRMVSFFTKKFLLSHSGRLFFEKDFFKLKIRFPFFVKLMNEIAFGSSS